jgi:hypothetical protein
VAQRRPPCDSTMERVIANPRPVPCGLVVKNALKICSTSPTGRPIPVSVTEINSSLSSTNCDLMLSSPSVSTPIASIPF